ncbi:Por secretion system C-terminal sorting domain-containing protein [Flavobacterium sp. CF108]|uniref:endonuclease n=1 Tax=unclassified Flavobacterium TaxID=196869 RepID=UPI0008BC10B9|nr:MULTISPECIES: endonuclease [unclassified Flavobacterium]SEN94093.1 Por secretion system C-terminal sorting domain-containing protein [Flavobacterium sp. fv08]SHH28484.1 Por secretion system C-terminal sorting domain-containing protein [Flavobacterium sp. CF108]
MKKNYFLLLLLSVTIGFAQIPSGYYNTATGTGYTLKTQLYNIIKGHTDNGYAGLYTTYQTSDVDNFYENDGTVLDMYSENPSGTDPYNYSTGSTQRCGNYSVEGDCYNREHIIPQSVFNEQSPMVADAHFITPTDGKVNGIRSNYPHGTVSSATYTSQNGGKLGSSSVSGYSGTVFEPINAFKGDIARMYFYFATRYENTVAGYSYAMFDGSSNKVFTTAFLNLLLAWNAQDPVSAREIARNNAIYARQNNRNPYIDHPEYVNQIWGGTPSGDTQAPTTPTSLASTSKTATSISLSWTASTDNVAVTGYDVYANSVLKTTVSGVTATITGLTASTAYSIYVKAKDAAGNASASSNTISVTTNSSGTGTATDLLFSEYIEGSGNNKALEIANNTGSSVSLSAYTIKKQTNGAGSWSTGLALSGTLTTGSKFVIVNSSISSSCFSPSSANISTTATELTFNGNDAVGLFKNGVLIDVIGTFNGGTANFAIDVTLRRKSTVTSPSTTFNLSSQWDSFTQDTCNNLASKIAKPIEEEVVELSDEIVVFPNPSDGIFNIVLDNSDSPYSIEILSFSGQKVFEKQNASDSVISVSHLSSGIYIAKITRDSKTIIKKIVIN